MDQERYERTIAAMDAVNAEDPNLLAVRGEPRPKELAHAELMTEWVMRLRPDAPEALLLAARAHHIRRWAWPREDYPEGRAGYLKWRKDLYDRHAELAASIMRDTGYDEATIARAGEIQHKQGLRQHEDPDVQTYEDALCLVFVETQFHDLAAKTEHDKMVEIVRKTLLKMSDDGRATALEIPIGADDAAIVSEALARL